MIESVVWLGLKGLVQGTKGQNIILHQTSEFVSLLNFFLKEVSELFFIVESTVCVRSSHTGTTERGDNIPPGGSVVCTSRTSR